MGGLEAERVAGDEADVVAQFFVPARAGFFAFVTGGVEAVAGDRHVGVPAVGVDGDPAAFAFFAPGHHRTGGKGAFEEFAAVQGVGDGARAVVAGGGEAGVAPAPDVGLGTDLVGRGDHGFDPGRGAGGRDQFARDQQLRFCGRRADVHFGGGETAG